MKNAQYLFIIVLCYVAMTGKAQNNRFTPPIMGWSSWNTYRININEQLIKKQADAIIDRGLKTVGYRYINREYFILIPSVFPTDWKTSLNIYMIKV